MSSSSASEAQTAEGGDWLQNAPLSTVSNFLVVNLSDNLYTLELERLESILLQELHRRTALRGVLFNFIDVITTDIYDLLRLNQMLKAISLLGARVGICGINPGLATVIVASGIELHSAMIGSDLDDLLAHI